MAQHPLLSMIPHEEYQLQRNVVARWTDAPGEFDVPDYGAFVDDRGLVVTGTKPSRAFLDSEDASEFELAPAAERELSGAHAFFLDWGRQTVSWEEIFALWEAWEAQGMIADCGSVSVSWPLVSRWSVPGWVAFRDGFNGEPLTMVPQHRKQTAVPAAAAVVPTPARATPKVPTAAPGSFLARALNIRGESEVKMVRMSEDELPMLPFTLDTLRDGNHAWPTLTSS